MVTTKAVSDCRRVLSLDPGFTTGYAVAEIVKDSKKKTQINAILRADMFKYPNLLEVLKIAKSCDVIVIEDFVTRPEFYGQYNYSDRVIGCFEVLYQNKEIVFQQPSEKPRCTDTLLAEMGLWHSSLHVRDALRHLVIWVRKQNKRKFKTIRKR